MHDINGNDLGAYIDDPEAENFCKVLDTGTPPEGEQVGYQVSVHYCDDGLPLIIYQHEGFKCSYRDGDSWQESTIYSQSNEPRDIEKTGPDSFRTYRTAGKSVYIFKTLDGGRSWIQEQKITAGQDIKRCYVINNYNDEVKLLLTENIIDDNVEEGNRDIFTGSVESTVSTKFDNHKNQNRIGHMLAQNYPNPFSVLGGSAYGGNPVTTIEYSIPANSRQYAVISIKNPASGIEQQVSSTRNQASSIQDQVSVSLKIYDILGREVASLVDQQQSPGNYKVQLDADNLAGGVYIYILRAGDYVESKKMIIIK